MANPTSRNSGPFFLPSLLVLLLTLLTPTQVAARFPGLYRPIFKIKPTPVTTETPLKSGSQWLTPSWKNPSPPSFKRAPPHFDLPPNGEPFPFQPMGPTTSPPPPKSPFDPSPPFFSQPPLDLPPMPESPSTSPSLAPLSPFYPSPLSPESPSPFAPIVLAPLFPFYPSPLSPESPSPFASTVPAPSPFNPTSPTFEQPPPSFAFPPGSIYQPQF